MSQDRSDRHEDPAEIATAVRALAADAHLILTRVAANDAEDHRATLRDLLRRVDHLQHLLGETRPSENRLHSLRIWLDNLERQVLIMQQMQDLRHRVERLEGRDAPGTNGAES